MAITQKMAQKLRELWPYCPHCGEDVGLQVHHRKNRGMGGSKLLDTYPNLIRVCAELNYAMESNAEISREARVNGWKLGQWDDFEQPVFDRMQNKWFYVTKEGEKHETGELGSLF
jgi:hypothetical protein